MSVWYSRTQNPFGGKVDQMSRTEYGTLINRHEIAVEPKPGYSLLSSCFYNVGYSRYNLYAIIVSALSLFKWTDFYAIVTCTTWGICISFHAALVCDPTCFRRIAASMNLGMGAFYTADFGMHILPCIITVCFPVRYMLWWHGGVAVLAHLSWGMVRSGGTMCLDELYVPMSKRAWYVMWTVAVLSETVVSLSPMMHANLSLT